MIRYATMAGLALVIIVTTGGGAGASELVVVEARGVSVAPGQVIDGAKSMRLLEGQQVTLLSQSGQIVKLTGPLDSAPDEQERSGGTDPATTVASLLTQQQVRTTEVGVIRGLRSIELPDPWLVDVSHPGTNCVLAGQPVVLWRTDDTAERRVIIAPADRSWSVTTTWPKGADRLTIPASIPFRDRTSYVVSIGDSLAPVALRVIPAAVGNDAMRASWMAEVGCGSQAQALLASINR